MEAEIHSVFKEKYSQDGEHNENQENDNGNIYNTCHRTNQRVNDDSEIFIM